MVFSHTLLGLDLGCHKLVLYIFHTADTGKGHLLFHVMAEPVTADGVAEDMGYDGAEEQTAIEHRLDRQTGTEGDRDAPVGIDDAQAGLLTQIGADG